MHTKIEKLIAILEQIHTAYAAMLPLLVEEKKAAWEGNAARLNHLTVEKAALVERLTAFEKTRSSLMVELAAEFDCAPKDLTTTYLTGRVGPPWGTRLDAVHTALRTLLFEVRAINTENQTSIRHALKIVQSGLGFFERITSGLPMYGASGGIDGSGGRHGMILSNTV